MSNKSSRKRGTSAGPEPSANGHGTPRRKTAGRRAGKPPVALPDSPETDGGFGGRLLSEVERRGMEWLFGPWVPLGMLTLIAGEPTTGKSTFVAALISHATGSRPLEGKSKAGPGRVVFLPGHEETVAVMTAPRLDAAGVHPDRVRLLEGHDIRLCRDKKRLAKELKDFGACLLIGDPIDSYVDDGFSEDRGQDVRPLLEAGGWIAEETGAAVVFARHPGKQAGNIMPGSRHWRNVPRVVVLLSSDGGIPPRYMLSPWKYSLGDEPSPRRYSLPREPGKPPVFTLEEEVDRSAELLTRDASGPTSRFKLMAACRLVYWLFQKGGTITRSELGSEGKKQGLGEDTLSDAMRLLGVKSIPPDERGLPWVVVRTRDSWPGWLLEQRPAGE